MVTMAIKPMLAVEMMGEGEIERIVDAVSDGKMEFMGNEERVKTGIRSIDGALGGGVKRGSVVGVSGEEGDGGREICLSFLVLSLLERPESTAAVVDSTGNLDVLRIYEIALSRLKEDEELRKKNMRNDNENEGVQIEDVAAKVLDRVKIMRVFDLVGLGEAIREINDGLEGVRKVEQEKSEGNGEEKPAREEVNAVKKTVEKKTVIADSEDEEDEEILFQPDPTPAASEAFHQQSPALPEPELETSSRLDKKPSEQEGKIDFILIDQLAHVLSPLLKKDHIQANAFASTFLQTLNHLTHTHTLLTLLLNPSHPSRENPHPAPNLHSNPQATILEPARPPNPIPTPSIFTSNKSHPALANLLPPYLDLHLLVSRLPRRKEDARALAKYGVDERGNRRRNVRGVEMVGVVEVLVERDGDRGGEWAAFGDL
ncbi:hypothetical protein B0J11DRAFT_518863 [Dendryphion nanum]|uniref:Uncharacterized protein n=1 Tax=Dendryphion nanum TaxID=256645 RepID=A0A9P9IYI1_9PLEO|nr:hypothetical protein B0J11DRAFT_518863 [Dendryphion nanum]